MTGVVALGYLFRERLDPNLLRFQSKVWLDMQRGCRPNKPDAFGTGFSSWRIVLTAC